MDIDHGPCNPILQISVQIHSLYIIGSNTVDYMTAVACCEQKWISQFSIPHVHDDPYHILPFQGDCNEHIKILSH